MVAVLVALVASSPTKGWSGRSLSLLDPYAPCFMNHVVMLYGYFTFSLVFYRKKKTR